MAEDEPQNDCDLQELGWAPLDSPHLLKDEPVLLYLMK